MLEAALSVRPPLRRSAVAGGAGAFLLGALLSLAGMLAKPAQLEFRLADTLLVALGVLLASGGALALVSRFASAAPALEPAPPVPARALLPGLLQLVVSGLALRFVINRAIAGTVPAPHLTLAVTVPALCLSLFWGALRCAGELGVLGGGAADGRWRRAWPAALGVLLYLPALGSFGMIDCWEPHYSEVAREMLARHDWISLWWGDQAWFWSKPILNFWLQGLSFSWFGLDPAPEQILQGIAEGRSPAPEWAARLPNVVCALAGPLVLQQGVARYFGARAARFGTLILLTCPYWFFLGRQTMVDMAYAAPLAAALGFLLLAGAAGEDERVRSYSIGFRRGSFCVSGYHLLFLGIGALALVQIFYLLSRHWSLELGATPGLRFPLRFHGDEVWAGSPGNCTLPGNAPCSLDRAATHARLQPGWSALLWAACFGALLWGERHERRLRGLYYLAAWFSVAVSVMGKGAPGLVLPVAALGAWLWLQRRLGELRQAKPGALLLILGCIAAPWFVQAYARHGAPFFDRLFLHDMYDRAFGHVHDTNAGVDTSFRYYVWQLGYGLFPWSGIAAAGTLFCVGESVAPATGARFRAGTQLLVAWQLACFGLFSLAGTKFHHYILPLVPAAAVLGGVLLDALWQRGRQPTLAVLGVGAALLTLLVGRDLARPGGMPGAARLIQLFTYQYSRPWPPDLDYRPALLAFGAAAALLCVACALAPLAWPGARRWAVAGLGAAGVAFAAWTLHVYLIEVAPHWSQRETIGHYYRARSGPGEPLVAYRQNWMGENFYTGNHLATFKASGKRFEDWVAERRRQGQRVLFFTTEHGTIERLKRELGGVKKFELLTDRRQNNKFVLVRAEL